jgi:hypothetical protein
MLSAAATAAAASPAAAVNDGAAPAAPAYQIQQYYIHGRVDDCSSKWSAMIDCFKKRTKFREEVR